MVTLAEQLIDILERKGRHFFHFTDTRNLPSIRQHGLLSMAQLRTGVGSLVAAGGNDWSFEADRRSGMDRYVHLCFFNEHPMEWLARQENRIESTTFLQVIPSILGLPGVLITDAVSNKADVLPLPANEMIGKLDLEVIYQRTDWRDKMVQQRLKIARRYEVLVPNQVALEYVRL
jgi:ssDNA thymidine ADP-ribosyltransferase, DarT